jgi:hypothetical protein
MSKTKARPKTKMKKQKRPKNEIFDVYRTFKDRAFRKLFSNINLVKQLVAAIFFTSIDEIKKIEFNTLSSPIFKSYQNDISVIVNDRLIILLEHQSTYNKNLRIKLMAYKADLITDYIQINNIDIHSSKDIIIPDVSNCVIYSGDRIHTDIINLESDFKFNSEFEQSKTSDAVTIYNISEGFNKTLKEKCEPLKHFATFLDKIKTNSLDKKLTPALAISKSIKECIKDGILVDFLSSNQRRVIKMYLKATDYEEEIKQEGITEGMEKGIEKGIKIGEEKGIKIGEEKGKRKGLFNAIIVLVSKENWTLAKAAAVFGLNETETRQLADELGSS